MYKHKLIGRAFLFGATMCILVMGFIPAAVGGEDQTHILRITVGQPTKLSDLVNQNTASLSVSRTGVVAAFYPKPSTGPKFYRTSADAGLTWGPEMSSPPQMGGGQCSGMLLGGGNIKPASGPGTPIDGEPGWFQMPFARFNDDFSGHSIETSRIYMPGAITKKLEGRSYVWNWPGFSTRMITLDNGDLMAAMYGLFEGDAVGSSHGSRVIVVRSNDDGRTWRYQGTVSNRADDPDPQLPGMFTGFTESNIAYLRNGQLLCIMRSQGSHLRGEYKPLYVSWSDDLGKTWTKPKPTQPHLMNILPTLVVLDNGVVACQHGRPGDHVSFSLDNGHTWQDRISFSDLPCGVITGQFDLAKAGLNRLVAVGNDAEGTKVWPIKVKRLKVSPVQRTLQGTVLDQQGNPITDAKIELGPNRYTADDWLIIPAYKGLANWYHELYFKERLMGDTPVLAYRSIQAVNHHPTVRSNAKGLFQFDDVGLNEYVLTVEADGYAPQHRHIKRPFIVGPEAKPHDFRLEAGQKICSRVVDDAGQPVPGACVVLNRWHVHTDLAGFFHWSVKSPVPQQVMLKVYKRYSNQYKVLETTVALSQLESQPITLKNK